MAYKFNPFTGTFDEVGAGGGGPVPDPLTLNELTVSTLLTAEHIHGNIAGSVYIHVKNTDTVELAKGTPFYITGTVGASDAVEIQAADSADPTKGPAVGLLEDTLAVNGEGNGTIIGEIYQYDTATPSWNTNDALYVANGGGLTNVEPTSGYRQIVAYAGRIQASTGTLILTGTSTDPVAGSNTQIQFNDNGGFGADSGLTFNKTTNALTVGASTVDGGSAKIYGDIDLDDGGSFSTTVQAVTPTANRTISFPDATGTVALVNGANGTIQYNDAGTLKGNSDFTVDPDWNDASTVFTGLKLNVTDGAGGSPVGAANSNLLDLQSGGASKAVIDSSGNLLIGGTYTTWLFNYAGAIYCKGAAPRLVLGRTDASGASFVNAAVFTNGSDGAVGTIAVSSTATVYNTSSDYRLKENVVPLTGAAERVNQLQVHRFNFIADPETTVDGFIAHEAQAVVPECVTGTKDEVDDEGNPVYQGIDQSKLVPLLTAALQEALAEIESLKARVTALEP